MIINTKTFLVFSVIALLMNVCYAQQASLGRPNEIRIGMIERSGHKTGEALADLLSVEFSRDGEIALLERDALDTIAQEKQLSAALSGPNERLELGKTAGADFLVIVDMENETREANRGRELEIATAPPKRQSHDFRLREALSTADRVRGAFRVSASQLLETVKAPSPDFL